MVAPKFIKHWKHKRPPRSWYNNSVGLQYCALMFKFSKIKISKGTSALNTLNISGFQCSQCCARSSLIQFFLVWWPQAIKSICCNFSTFATNKNHNMINTWCATKNGWRSTGWDLLAGLQIYREYTTHQIGNIQSLSCTWSLFQNQPRHRIQVKSQQIQNYWDK